MLRLCDIAAIADMAHAFHALLIVDSTWLSPVLFQPFKLGADLVLHSATKYLGGHSGTFIQAHATLNSDGAHPCTPTHTQTWSWAWSWLAQTPRLT